MLGFPCRLVAHLQGRGKSMCFIVISQPKTIYNLPLKLLKHSALPHVFIQKKKSCTYYFVHNSIKYFLLVCHYRKKFFNHQNALPSAHALSTTNKKFCRNYGLKAGFHQQQSQSHNQKHTCRTLRSSENSVLILVTTLSLTIK